jgi:phosphinothricin acetyltransferase
MIRIRPATPADAAQIALIYSLNIPTGVVVFDEHPLSESEMRARMAASDGLYPWLVATNGEDDTVIGYAFASRFREPRTYRFVVETRIFLAGDMNRQGLGRLLYDALLDTLRAQRFTQAIAAIALPNDAQIGLHESVGFRRAGVYREVACKDGRWIDIGLWQASLAEPTTPPQDPRPFSEVGLVREP